MHLHVQLSLLTFFHSLRWDIWAHKYEAIPASVSPSVCSQGKRQSMATYGRSPIDPPQWLCHWQSTIQRVLAGAYFRDVRREPWEDSNLFLHCFFSSISAPLNCVSRSVLHIPATLSSPDDVGLLFEAVWGCVLQPWGLITPLIRVRSAQKRRSPCPMFGNVAPLRLLVTISIWATLSCVFQSFHFSCFIIRVVKKRLFNR